MRSLVPDVTEGPRTNILDVVERAPGTHLRGIERATALPLGQVLYHLDRLERMGLVVSARDAGFRRYFATRGIGRIEKRTLSALRSEAPRRIVLTLLARGPLPHKELQAALGVAGSTLSFHLQRLLAIEVLRRDRVGATNVYALTDPVLARRDLVYYRESFQDPEVDRFVQEVLASLPAPEAPPRTITPSAPS